MIFIEDYIYQQGFLKIKKNQFVDNPFKQELPKMFTVTKCLAIVIKYENLQIKSRSKQNVTNPLIWVFNTIFKDLFS